MINRPKLLADLKVQVRDLESDLRSRFATHAEYKSRLTTDWQTARDAGRTSEALETWAEAQFTQSAVAWVLACVFVRFCEDNDLLDAPLIAGTDARGQSAVARQEAFYLQNPTASDNDYLRDVFAVASRLPGLSDVMKVQRVLLTAPVSADMGKQLVRFFRATNADTGALVHDFADPDWNTRFLGDLYQDLSEAARERYALLQTPEFVESFILDRTLTPALGIYTLEEVDLIDPTCGSGHFLLGAFERLRDDLQDLVILTWLAKSNRSLYRFGQPFKGEIGNVPNECEVREQPLPTTAEWDKATKLAGDMLDPAMAALYRSAPWPLTRGTGVQRCAKRPRPSPQP